MIPSDIPIPLPGGLDVEVPRFVKVHARFPDPRVEDVPGVVSTEMERLELPGVAGKRIAIGVGSRGIRPQPPVVKAVIEALLEREAKPFVIPAMGSHGGGNAEGQTQILSDYGFTEDYLGVPVEASMDVVTVGKLPDGTAVYCDRVAWEADYIVPVNRVKPHTDFRAKHESGLIKMIAIGLSKHAGAEAMHWHGMENFHEMLPAAARVFLDNTRTLFGVAMVENAYDHLMHVELVPAADVFERDAALQALAKDNIAKLLFETIDVLVVDEIGKNISGAGMDPNVTGRPSTGLPGFEAPDIRQILVRDLTEATHGNGTGIAAADVTTQRVARKMDYTKTYVNIVTAGVISGGKMPVVANTDKEAFAIALRGCSRMIPAKARIVRITNTLELTELWASEPLREEIEAHPDMEVVGEPFEADFGNDGTLRAFP